MSLAEISFAVAVARRELRGGFAGFLVFLACLAVGVAAIAAVGLLNASVADAVRRDSRILLGGDVAFEGSGLPPPEMELRALLPEAATMAATLRTNAIVTATNGRSLVVSLKAVDPRYPLYGEVGLDPPLPLAQALDDRGAVAEATLLSRLGLALGEKVRIGNLEVTIRAVLEREPDQFGGFVDVGPRLVLSRASALATGLLQPGSLIRWRYAARVPGESDTRALVRTLERASADSPWRVRGAHEVEPQVARFTDRLATYMTMAGLAALLVGGLGIGLAVRGYLAGKTTTIATLKCLGAPSRLIFATYLLQVLALATLGVGAGLLLGHLVPVVFVHALSGTLPVAVEINPQIRSLLLAAAAGMVTALVFALWPLALAREVSPAGLFRALVVPTRRLPRPFYLAILGLGVASLCALAVLGTDRARLGLIFVASALGGSLALALLTQILLGLARRLAEFGPLTLRMAVHNLVRPGSGAASVAMALGAGLGVLTTVALLDANLGRELRERVPERTPSTVFIDIQPAQWERFQQIVSAEPGARILQHYPLLRGRVVGIDGRPVGEVPIAEHVRWTIRRDRGLTFLAEPTAPGEIVAGQWWPADYAGPPLLSIEKETAEGYGVGIGDTITFNMLGRNIEATIANLRREIDWASGRLDFLFILSPGVIDKAPYTLVAAADVPPASDARILDRLAAELPNVTPIPVGEVLERVAAIFARIGFAIRSVAAVTLVTGVLVLVGAIIAARHRQRYQSVILKVLGARRSDVLRLLGAEYLILGLAAAVLGTSLGALGAWALVRFAFDMPWGFFLWPVATLAATTLALTLALGGVATWRLLGRPAAPVLRQP